MTLKGKRMQYKDDPEAQLQSIKEAYSFVPTKPLERRYPAAVWPGDNCFHMLKITRKGLSHSILGEWTPRPSAQACSGVLEAASYLGYKYHRKISLLDVEKAFGTAVSIKTLKETRSASIIWWLDDGLWGVCSVRGRNIIWSRYPGRNLQPKKEYDGSFIRVKNDAVCIRLLRDGFGLDVDEELFESACENIVKVKNLSK